MEIYESSQLFSALGQPTRLEILRTIAPFSHGEDAMGIPAGEIARILDLPAATLSFHLKDMTYKKVVRATRSGRKVFYRVDIDVLLHVLDGFVTEICEI